MTKIHRHSTLTLKEKKELYYALFEELCEVNNKFCTLNLFIRDAQCLTLIHMFYMFSKI